jgi:hypothetical protein
MKGVSHIPCKYGAVKTLKIVDYTQINAEDKHPPKLIISLRQSFQ